MATVRRAAEVRTRARSAHAAMRISRKIFRSSTTSGRRRSRSRSGSGPRFAILAEMTPVNHDIEPAAAGAVRLLIEARNRDPFALLGPHRDERGGGTVVRAFQPEARSIELRLMATGELRAMEKVDPAGIFEIRLNPTGDTGAGYPDYRLRITFHGDHVSEIDDPYRYGRVLTDFDLHLFAEGTHYRAYDKLGAHRMTKGPTNGVHVAVWAPNAERVSVIGDFNGWDGRVQPMRLLTPSGVWELFIPNLPDGEKYKFEIRTPGGAVLKKSDPYAFAFEVPPQSASVVRDITRYQWHDAGWMSARQQQNRWFDRPMTIYEAHLGSWCRVPEEGNRFLSYRELAHRLVPYVQDLGFTHIELLPVMEHPFSGSWGYQVLGFFAPTARFGPPEDFKFFVDACHASGIGVILDWVPGHFPKDEHGLARFDGTALFEHEDPRQGEHQDWGTLIFNYGRNEVRNFLLSKALFWLEEYYVDGLRVDAVASMLYLDYSRREGEWIPNRFGGRENLDAVSFLQELNRLTHTECPGALTIAEESTAWPQVTRPPYMGGLGFSLKWNMGWMHDTLEYISKEPIHRRYHHNDLTFSLLYAFHENFVLPFSHDEVVHGKGSLLSKVPGDAWQKFATLRLLYAYMFGHPGKKLLFMGLDFGQGDEWSEARSIDWHLVNFPLQGGLQRCVADLHRVYRSQPSLHEVDFHWEGFQWLESHDNENS